MLVAWEYALYERIIFCHCYAETFTPYSELAVLKISYRVGQILGYWLKLRKYFKASSAIEQKNYRVIQIISIVSIGVDRHKISYSGET